MTDSSTDTSKHGVEAEALIDKVNRWIALPMLAFTLVNGIIDVKTGNIGWAVSMFLCATWWICIIINEFIRYKSRRHGTSS